jgi:hypothetical protein
MPRVLLGRRHGQLHIVAPMEMLNIAWVLVFTGTNIADGEKFPVLGIQVLTSGKGRQCQFQITILTF